MKILAAVLLVASYIVACAPRQPITTWYYSDWYREGGTGELGQFEKRRAECLKLIGVDPTSVTPNSPEEDTFLRCMNQESWCTDSYECSKPGVS